MSMLRVSGFVRESVVDGPGIRAVLYVQGCPHHCPGCHNPSTWDFEGGYNLAVEEIARLVEPNKLLQGFTLSGGEPFEQAPAAVELLKIIKEAGLNVVTYSGYTFEELVQIGLEKPDVLRLLEATDILVDGKYLEGERDLSLAFRGSKNQRLIDVRCSLEKGRPVLWER